MSKEAAEAKAEKAKAKYEKAKQKEAETLAAAQAAQAEAATAGYKDASLNEKAKSAIDEWRDAHRSASGAKKKTKASPYNQIFYLIILCILFALLFSVGVKFMGDSVGKFIAAFPFVFVIAVLAYLLAGKPP